MLKIKTQNIFIRVTAFTIYNLYLWRLLNMDCYIGDTLFDVLKYFLIAMACCGGLWLATTNFGTKYKKITSLLVIPSFIITPFFVTAEYYIFTIMVIISGVLALSTIFRGTDETMATSTEK